jgi:hypothetical protein
VPVASEHLSAFYDARSSEKFATSDNPEMLNLVDRFVSWCNISDGSRLLGAPPDWVRGWIRAWWLATPHGREGGGAAALLREEAVLANADSKR